MAALTAAPLLPGWCSAVLYILGGVLCHQIPERSFHLFGSQLPVCGRCLGLYLGASLGAAASLLAAGTFSAPLPNARIARRLMAVAASPTLLSVILELSGLWNPSNATRAIAALPLGAAAALVVMEALHGSARREQGRTAERARRSWLRYTTTNARHRGR